MDQRLQDPAGAAPPDWRGLCEELVEALDGWHQAVFETGVSWVRPDETYLLDRARAALAAEAVVEGPSLEDVERLCEEHCFNVEGYESIECLQGLINDALARWGRPAPVPPGERQAAPVPVPGASHVYFEFVISDADDCTQAGGIAPTYAQALSEGQHYLAQYQQDGPHTLELRRVEVLPPGAFPVPDDAPLPTPVPVSERLPEPEDCDAEGRVWGTAELGGWRLVHHSKIGLWRAWLPATALPLPSGEVQP